MDINRVAGFLVSGVGQPCADGSLLPRSLHILNEMVPMRIFSSRHASDVVDIQTGEYLPAIWKRNLWKGVKVGGTLFEPLIMFNTAYIHSSRTKQWASKYCVLRFRMTTGFLRPLVAIYLCPIVYMPTLYPPTHLPAEIKWSIITITRHVYNHIQKQFNPYNQQ